MSVNNYYQNRWYEGQKNPNGIVFVIYSGLSGNKFVGYTTNSVQKRFNQYWSDRFNSKTKLAKEMQAGNKDDFVVVVYKDVEGESDGRDTVRNITMWDSYIDVREK